MIGGGRYLPPPAVLPPRARGAQIALTEACHPDLRRLLTPGDRWVVPIMRVSLSPGPEARSDAANGHDTMARRLARYGVDYCDALPRIEDLQEAQLTSGEMFPFPRYGGGFIEVHVTLVQVEDVPLMLGLISGTGSTTDEDEDQPSILTSAAVLEQYLPALTVVPELFRLGREPWTFKRIVDAFRACQRRHGPRSWLAYEDRERAYDRDAMRVEEFTDETGYRLFDAGREGRQEALRTARRTAGGRQSRAARSPQLVRGRMLKPTPGPVIPGMGQGIMLPTQAGRGDSIAYIDAAWARPEQSEMLTRLPEVRGPQKQLVDQWETLEWLCRTARRPGWTSSERLAGELARRKFSTDALRRRNRDPNYLFQPTPNATSQLFRTIFVTHWDALFGQYVEMELGDGGGKRRIPGLPPIMDEEDYYRIKEWHERKLNSRADVYLFTGVRARLLPDAVDGVLAGNRRTPGGPVEYRIISDYARGAVTTRLDPAPLIPETEILRAIGNLLADEHATFTPDTDAPPEAITALEAKVEQTQNLIARMEKRQASRWQKIDHEDREVDHTYLRLKSEYDRTETELIRLRLGLEPARAEIERMRASYHVSGIRVDDLFQLPRALTDPTDRGLRDLLLPGLDGVIEVQRPTHTQPHGFDLQDVVQISVPVTVHDPEVGRRRAIARGAFATKGQLRGQRRLYRVLEALTEGVPYPDLDRNGSNQGGGGLVRLRAALGEDCHGWVLSVTEPDILRPTMLVCYPLLPLEQVSTEARLTRSPLGRDQLIGLAETTGYGLDLLHRILDLHQLPQFRSRSWLWRQAPQTAQLYATARRRGAIPLTRSLRLLLATPRNSPDWDVHDDVATLRPCAHCGTRRSHPCRLRQATGAVCRSCYRDRALVPWRPSLVQPYLE